MNRRQLKQLLTGSDPVKRFRTVRTVLPRNIYLVADAAGNETRVESTATYTAGDLVTVIDGRIVGPARRFARGKTYRV